jgi:hypothetical protein
MMVNPDYTDNAKVLVNAQTGKRELLLQSSGKAYRPFRIKSATLKACGATLTQCPGGFFCLLSECLFPGPIKTIHNPPHIRSS